GGAALATGAVTGILALSQKSTLSANCKDGQCGPEERGTLDSYHTLTGMAIGGLASGAVGLGVAATTRLTSSSARRTAMPRAGTTGFTITPFGTMNGVGAVGTF